MKGWFNFRTIAIVIVATFMFTFILNILAPLLNFADRNTERRYDLVLSIIDKALVQCYAMEGSYPTEIEYLTNYGLVLDTDSYHYQLLSIGDRSSNIKPSVQIFER